MNFFLYVENMNGKFKIPIYLHKRDQLVDVKQSFLFPRIVLWHRVKCFRLNVWEVNEDVLTRIIRHFIVIHERNKRHEHVLTH